MPAVETMPRARFSLLLAALLAGYAALQVLYVTRQPLIMDEFAGAAEVYNLAHGIPYRDYVPYKTVLGYAIQSMAAAVADDAWTQLIAIKLQTVIVNAGMLAVVGIWLARLYGRRSALLALVVMSCSSLFLERSSELRVDMLTAWFGVLSLLALLDRKPAWAGVLLAVSFGVSQKAALYAVATEAAFAALFLGSPGTRRDMLRSFLQFNVAFAAGVASYIAIWSIPSSLQTVVGHVFGIMGDAAAIDVYAIRWRYWSQTLIRNPAVFLLTAIALWQLRRMWPLTLTLSPPLNGERRLASRETEQAPLPTGSALLLVFTIVVLAQAVWYPTPWPYFFVIIWPTLLVLHAAALETMLPLRRPAYAAFIMLAVLYPLLRVPVVLARDNDYQRHTIELADALLEPGETYLAATPLLPHRRQAVERLAWVDAIQIALLQKEAPATWNGIVAQLERNPPKLLISNYRIRGLPAPIRNWLDRHYAQLAASVHVYAPLMDAGQGLMPIAFSGRYRVELQQQNGTALVDGRPRQHGELFELTRGTHTVAAATGVRLRLLPHGVEQHIDPELLREQLFFRNLYDE